MCITLIVFLHIGHHKEDHWIIREFLIGRKNIAHILREEKRSA